MSMKFPRVWNPITGEYEEISAGEALFGASFVTGPMLYGGQVTKLLVGKLGKTMFNMPRKLFDLPTVTGIVKGDNEMPPVDDDYEAGYSRYAKAIAEANTKKGLKAIWSRSAYIPREIPQTFEPSPYSERDYGEYSKDYVSPPPVTFKQQIGKERFLRTVPMPYVDEYPKQFPFERSPDWGPEIPVYVQGDYT